MARSSPPFWTPTRPRTDLAEVFRSAGEFFRGRSPVHLAAESLSRRLGGLGIPFAVTGDFALGGHGYVRATEDIDIVVRRADWLRFIQLKIASGKTALGRHLRDYSDVVELIRANGLDASFAEHLDPYVRTEFLTLHGMANQPYDSE